MRLINIYRILFCCCFFIYLIILYSKFPYLTVEDNKVSHKIKNIEFLRVVLTLQVLWCHFSVTLDIWNAAHLAVEAFFLLSGFFLTKTVFLPNKDGQMGQFIKNKLIRFMPLVCFGVFLSLLYPFEKNIKAEMLLADFLLYSGTGLGGIGWGYNPPAWYISVLFWVSCFYYYIIRTFKREYANIIIGTISFICFFFYVNNNDGMIGFIHSRFLFGLSLIGIGYFLFIICNQLKEKEIKLKKIYSIIEAVIIMYAIGNICIHPLFLGNGKIVSSLMYALTIVILILRKGYISIFLEKDIFVKMGKYCLSIFLTHFVLVWNIFRDFFEYKKDFCLSHPLAMTMVVFLGAVLLGIIAHHTIEIPATKVLKKWLR